MKVQQAAWPAQIPGFEALRSRTDFVYALIRMKERKSGPVAALTPQALELVASQFRAMSEPLRLRILQELTMRGESSVSALAELVQSTQPNASKHLKVLQDAGLIRRRQQGNCVFYSVMDPMVFELCEMICARLRQRLQAQVVSLNRRRPA